MGTSHLIDVSAYQGAQDWAKLKASGIAGAFAKASEGMHGRDGHFATHIKGIKGAGLVPGAYHFAWPNQDVAAEAANYISAVKSYAGKGFTHWLDLERYSDGRNYKGESDAGIKAWASKWISLVKAAFPGQRVGVYTSAEDLSRGHYPDNSDALWYPAYVWGYTAVGYDKAETHARPIPAGHTVFAWQFTSTPVDRSLCYKSTTELRQWAGLTAKPSAPKSPATYVDLSNVVAAAKRDPKLATGATTHKADVLRVERALHAEGLLGAVWVDGSYGTKTLEAYKKWQRRCGYTGSDADGIPGSASLTKLGKSHGFAVRG